MDAAEQGLDQTIERRRVRRKRRTPAVTEILEFLWPGLGLAYARRGRQAIVWALPPTLLVLAVIFLVVSDPSEFALNLLSPSVAAIGLVLIAAHAIWRIAAIFNVWRLARTSVRALTDRTLPLAVLLAVGVAAAHVTAGVYVQSFGNAGARIFTGDRPTGSGEIDNVLGGGPDGEPADPVLGPGDLDGDGHADGDLNGDGVVDARDDLDGDGLITGDDIDYGDINGDGVVDENDFAIGEPVDEGDTNGDGVVDENDDDPAEPSLGPGPTFNPDLTPPPLDPGPSITPAPGTSPAAPTPTSPPNGPTSTPLIPGPPDGPVGDLPGEGPINVLFVGLDSGFGRGHSLSDTIMVASYFPSRDRVTMISIPRDTGRLPLYTGGTYPNRINTFLGYAGRHPEIFPEGPIAALMREVGYLLGTTIHYYAATNLEGLPRAVDVVGGVTITVTTAIISEKSNYYVYPGTYHMNGAEALQYARVRYGSSDFARAKRQQQVIKALAARVRDPSVAFRLPEVVDALSEVVRTNAPRSQASTLARILERANDASTENIVLKPSYYALRIPAAEVNGRYMIQLNIAAIRELSLRVFGSYSRYS